MNAFAAIAAGAAGRPKLSTLLRADAALANTDDACSSRFGDKSMTTQVTPPSDNTETEERRASTSTTYYSSPLAVRADCPVGGRGECFVSEDLTKKTEAKMASDIARHYVWPYVKFVTCWEDIDEGSEIATIALHHVPTHDVGYWKRTKSIYSGALQQKRATCANAMKDAFVGMSDPEWCLVCCL